MSFLKGWLLGTIVGLVVWSALNLISIQQLEKRIEKLEGEEVDSTETKPVN